VVAPSHQLSTGRPLYEATRRFSQPSAMHHERVDDVSTSRRVGEGRGRRWKTARRHRLYRFDAELSDL
jgi:hypothetical protein